MAFSSLFWSALHYSQNWPFLTFYFILLCFTLQKNWSWKSELENQIRINFEKTASDHFIDLLFCVRRDLPKKPSWMCPVVFEALKEY